MIHTVTFFDILISIKRVASNNSIGESSVRQRSRGPARPSVSDISERARTSPTLSTRRRCHQHLVTAAALLAERVGDVLALSDMYETEPWGFESDNTFLNAVIVMTTELSPMELLDATRLIEIEMGRIEKSDGVYHDRIIDIDLLMVDEQILHTERLTLPHPLMHKRSFVMEPLAEVAPLVKHPVFGKTMRELLSEL